MTSVGEKEIIQDVAVKEPRTNYNFAGLAQNHILYLQINSKMAEQDHNPAMPS
jgi:hypothetical protein